MIPYGRQTIDEDDINSVIEILRSDWLTQGPTVEKFENEICRYTGASHALSMNSATSALHAACVALGVVPGDVVWTSANTFVASANCALYCGAEVDFVDICPQNFNMNVECLRSKLIQAKSHGKLPKVVIPVHFGGQSCQMQEIKKLAEEYEFKIIEDASHALGAEHCGQKVGCCQYSDITIFSFHPVKMITTGEGGMALTNSKVLNEKMLRFRTHGITRNPENFLYTNKGEIWGFQQIDLGFNYRMTDIQAALGLSQLKKLNLFVDLRIKVAKKYDEAFMGTRIEPQLLEGSNKSSYHLYTVRLKSLSATNTQLDVFRELRSRGIGVNLHYIPVYRHPYFKRCGFSEGYCQEAEAYFKNVLSLPIYPNLSSPDQNMIIETLLDAVN